MMDFGYDYPIKTREYCEKLQEIKDITKTKIIVVSGSIGSGKTRYIKKQIKKRGHGLLMSEDISITFDFKTDLHKYRGSMILFGELDNALHEFKVIYVEVQRPDNMLNEFKPLVDEYYDLDAKKKNYIVKGIYTWIILFGSMYLSIRHLIAFASSFHNNSEFIIKFTHGFFYFYFGLLLYFTAKLIITKGGASHE